MTLPKRYILLFLVLWVFPFLLFILTADHSLQFLAHKVSIKNMNKLHYWVEKYQKHYKKFPSSPRVVKQFALAKSSKINIYDNYGYKLDIRFLDSSTTLIKSWGRSSFKDHNSRYARDLFYTSKKWANLFPQVIHNYPKPPSLYQPAQLISSTSYDKEFTARLFVNALTNNRTLVVVRNSDKKDPIFIYDDNQPEEFIWFPGSRLLVFTSDPVHSQKGPLHIYDADLDELLTIKIDLENQIDHKTTSEIKRYIAALAGAEDDKLYVYLIPYQRKPLSPDQIFHSKNLYQVHVTFPHGEVLAEAKRINMTGDFSLRREYSSPKVGSGNQLQNLWFNLKIEQNIERSIDKWQQFSLVALEQNSPITPYAMITLIDLYYRASKEYSISQKIGSAKLLALKYSKLVAQTPTFPTWLNLAAWECLNQLIVGSSPSLSLITPVSREQVK